MPKESAEEKLLKMMKKSSPSAVKPSFKKKFKFTFTVRDLNRLLFAAIVVCVAVLALEIHNGFLLLATPAGFLGESKVPVLSQTPMPSPAGLDYYLRPVHERNIFKPYVPKTAGKARAEGFAQMMSRYKLVGIAWLDLPETASVMIEDTKKNKTFFLKTGEHVEGVTVKAIYTDRAVFSHENEEMTIKL